METIDVAAGLIMRQGKLLITRRKLGSHLGGLWEFPGGKREPGETFEDCLVRELKEELGIEVRVGAEAERVVHSYPEKRVALRFYHCDWESGEPQSLGCEEFAWVEMKNLEKYLFPEADRELVRRLVGRS